MLWILALVAFAIFIYNCVFKTWSHFADRKLAFERGYPLLGWLTPVFFQKSNISEEIAKIYRKHPSERFLGLYEMGGRTSILVRDPELMRTICVREFDSFVNHNFNIDIDPIMGRALFFMKDQKWRDMRSILSPLFTGSKMRNMIKLIDEVAIDSTDTLRERVETTGEFNIIQTLKALTCDVILTCALGIRVNSLQDPENEFFKSGLAIAYALQSIRVFISSSSPALAKLFRIKTLDPKYDDFFRNLIRENIKQRKEKGIVRDDMIHLLMQAQEGNLKQDEEEDAAKDSDAGFATVAVNEEISKRSIDKLRDLTEDDFVAQCLLFFLAGFTGTATSVSLLLYELAREPEIQARLRQEIDEAKAQLNGGALSYDVIQRMKYLDMVVSETLRFWPNATALDRKVSKPFEIENYDGQKLSLAPGDFIWFPVFAMHRDEQFFPEPDKFDPERFSDKNKHNVRAYAPFGLGPRACIASRFALMSMKALVFRLVEKFEFECGEKTAIPLILKKGASGLEFEGDIWLRIKNRNSPS